MNLFAGRKVDAADLVDDVTQQVTADHAVLYALEHVGNDFSLAAFLPFTSQRAQVRKQPFADAAVRASRDLLTDERQQFVAGVPVVARGPVTPAVWRFYDGLVALAVERASSS